MSRYYDYDTLCKGMHDVVLKNGALHRCIDDIKILDLPTADVRENVRGKWVKVDEQPYFRKHFHKVCCSVCRKQGYDYWNFCPNCGADMRGDNNV